MIDHLNWESLEQRRQRARVIMLYKIIHNEVDITLKHKVTLRSNSLFKTYIVVQNIVIIKAALIEISW